MDLSRFTQVIMATHAPMLMAYPAARLLQLSKAGLKPITVEETEHYRLLRAFWSDPAGFVAEVMER